MKVGIIGCGHVARMHMNAYERIDDTDVIAVSDLNLERAKSFCSDFKIEKSFQNYTDLLDQEIDFVDICTPTSTHASIVCDVAKSRCDILVEKPMALSTSECERMIAETKKYGNKLSVCHTKLFIPAVMQAKSLIGESESDIISFRTSFKASFELMTNLEMAQRWNAEAKEGGILWEVACHPAYLHLHFLPEIKEVYAVGNKVKYPVYDEFTVLLRTASQSYGIIEVSWIAKEMEVIYEINFSDEKRINIYPEFDYLIEKNDGGAPPKSGGDVVRNMYTDEKRVLQKWIKFGVNKVIRKGYLIPHFNLINNFVEYVKNDSPPPVTPEEGKKTVKLLECIKESLNEHKSIPFN